MRQQLSRHIRICMDGPRAENAYTEITRVLMTMLAGEFIFGVRHKRPCGFGVGGPFRACAGHPIMFVTKLIRMLRF